MLVNQMACVEIILKTDVCLFFNPAEIQKAEPSYEEMQAKYDLFLVKLRGQC